MTDLVCLPRITSGIKFAVLLILGACSDHGTSHGQNRICFSGNIRAQHRRTTKVLESKRDEQRGRTTDLARLKGIHVGCCLVVTKSSVGRCYSYLCRLEHLRENSEELHRFLSAEREGTLLRRFECCQK